MVVNLSRCCRGKLVSTGPPAQGARRQEGASRGGWESADVTGRLVCWSEQGTRLDNGWTVPNWAPVPPSMMLVQAGTG
jgi:hypothetical protein